MVYLTILLAVHVTPLNDETVTEYLSGKDVEKTTVMA
jgi:hypothetical protein